MLLKMKTMSLKKRLLLILCTSGFILAVLFHFSFNITMVPDLEEQKRIIIERLKDKLEAVLLFEENNIDALGKSFAKMGGRLDPQRFASDFAVMTHKINFILITDRKGEIVFNRNYLEDLNFIALENLDIRSGLDFMRARVNRTGVPFQGIVNSPYGPLVMAVHPVIITGRSCLLMLGRFLDKSRTKYLSFSTEEEIRPITVNDQELFASLLKQMNGNAFFHREDKEKIISLYLARDVFNQPSVILSAETPYKLLWVTESHTLLYIYFLILSMLVLGVLVYYLIERYINKRVAGITLATQNVQGLRDVSLRIPEDSYGDEISVLITNINQMLNKIQKEKESREHMELGLQTNEKLVSIGRMSASLAHEINNPVLAISNCIQALKRTCKQCKGDEANMHRQAVDLSELEIQRVRLIIANLLDYHSVDRKEAAEVDLDDVLLQSMEILKWSKKLGGIKIITKKEQHFIVFGSQGKLKQVFINLISNAAEAVGDAGAQLRIEMVKAETDGFCDIHFYDNGPGVAAQIKDHLFEPFTSSKQAKGVGLGLYVSYKIIESHKGEIIYDDSYTDGAHFIVRLPLKGNGTSKNKNGMR